MGRLALPLAAAALLSACAPSFEARVARFSALPTPPAKTFYVEPANKAYVGGLEFASYAKLVKTQMLANGFTEVAAPGSADVTVMLDYDVGAPQQRIQTRPGTNIGWGGGWGAPRLGWRRLGLAPLLGRRLGRWLGRRRLGRRRLGRRLGWRLGPGSLFGDRIYHLMAMKMVRTADKTSLFEGRADTTSRTGNLPALMPNLVRAMFTQFPGTNGQTVRVRFNPNDPASVPNVTAIR